MLPLVTLLVLSGSPPAGGKPVVPVIFAQQLFGNSVGPELVNGQPSPSVEISEGDWGWLAVEVWATTGGEAGAPHPETVELTVKQGKRIQVFKARQLSEMDAEHTPFFVPVTSCANLELSARVGKRKSAVVKLAVTCG